jgi:hypothetical protein
MARPGVAAVTLLMEEEADEAPWHSRYTVWIVDPAGHETLVARFGGGSAHQTRLSTEALLELPISGPGRHVVVVAQEPEGDYALILDVEFD